MTGGIQIRVNGEPRAWRSGATVSDLLRDLDIKADRVAVELNLEILDRAIFGQRELRDGDRVEILSFIGGGTRAASGDGIMVQGSGENECRSIINGAIDNGRRLIAKRTS